MHDLLVLVSRKSPALVLTENTVLKIEVLSINQSINGSDLLGRQLPVITGAIQAT